MARIRSEDLAIEQFRLVEAPRTVMLQGCV
jgi:hypothetical protein